MRYRPLGQSGIEASVIGLGAWAIGGWGWGGTDEETSIAAIHAALDEGVNLIDTAPVYGFGVSELIVGKALRGRRDKAVIATKCGLVWDGDKGAFHFETTDDADAQRPRRRVYKHLAPDSIRRELEQSLQRLGTDRIDLYQTHWQDPTSPIEETMGALLDLKRRGKIRAIGVSNVSVEQLRRYQAVGPVDSDQEKFSMLDRQHEAHLIPACAADGVAFLAYSPLAGGLLSGKVGEDRVFPEGDSRRDNPRFSRENRRKVLEMLEEFKHLAHGCGLDVAELVLLWTISQPGVTHALAGARTPEQAVQNARAASDRLDDYDFNQMQEAMDKHLPGLATA